MEVGEESGTWSAWAAVARQEDSPFREEFEDKDHWCSLKGDVDDLFWKVPH